ncbi:DUF1304 family protein [Ruegeria marisrubri]|uniref:DUF1304 family protein n=1 Tax=Ruegeria marisrubri TaxID=1685379 RepID=UPI001CD3CA50|nr:DUF1304 family protein [Ruegeria marisrubri]MCA0905466.1 DUF1304 family protein [Ruegeria marisrubri]
MTYFYWMAVAAVIGGHFFFAYLQWFRWSYICKKLTNFSEEEIKDTAFLGRSFSSYNASIAVGLCLSFWLPAPYQAFTQSVVLLLISITAIVGALGTRGNTILIMRLIPASVAFVISVLV